MVLAALGCGAVTAAACWRVGGVATRRDKREARQSDLEAEMEAEMEAQQAEMEAQQAQMEAEMEAEAEAQTQAEATAPAPPAPAPSPPPAATSSTPAPAATTPSESSSGDGSAEAAGAAAEDTDGDFSLSTERLSEIAALNARLEPVADLLGGVPVFTVTIGGSTSPLTVPGPDGTWRRWLTKGRPSCWTTAPHLLAW